MSKWRPQQ